MLSLFRKKPLLDEGTTEWLWESYAWALRNFDRDLFYSHTTLVTPSKEHFPDQADDGATLAQLILDRIKGYMAMQKWPTRLIPVSEEMPALPSPAIAINGPARGDQALIEIDHGQALPVYYDPILLRQPDLLIAMMAQTLASPLAQLAPESPPGGDETRGHATDLLAIFMGFGVFLTNNAFNYHVGGCGSCSCKPKGVQLLGELTEGQMAYALALFCVLKEIPNSDVLPHLKSTVRPFYKLAVKEVNRKKNELAQLRSL
jgi:hypothetical protein